MKPKTSTFYQSWLWLIGWSRCRVVPHLFLTVGGSSGKIYMWPVYKQNVRSWWSEWRIGFTGTESFEASRWYYSVYRLLDNQQTISNLFLRSYTKLVEMYVKVEFDDYVCSQKQKTHFLLSLLTSELIMQIIIPVDSGDKPKRPPPSRFAARMRMQESEKISAMKKEQPEVVKSTSSILQR